MKRVEQNLTNACNSLIAKYFVRSNQRAVRESNGRLIAHGTAATAACGHHARHREAVGEKPLVCRGCPPYHHKPEKCAMRMIVSFHPWTLRTAFRFIKGSQVLQTRVTRPTKLSKHPYFEIHLNTKLAVKTWCRNIKSAPRAHDMLDIRDRPGGASNNSLRGRTTVTLSN